jgi:hypothetical protein
LKTNAETFTSIFCGFGGREKKTAERFLMKSLRRGPETKNIGKIFFRYDETIFLVPASLQALHLKNAAE